jgi:predicted amidophosphoribosyltransferase
MEVFAIVVWSLAFVLLLVALALPCPLCRRDVKDWSTCCNKCVASLLGLVFVSHLVTSDEGTLQSRWFCNILLNFNLL